MAGRAMACLCLARPPPLPLVQRVHTAAPRLFSSARVARVARRDRAVVFSAPGPPHDVLSVLTIPSPSAPAHGAVNIRHILSPINPSDINVVEGVYPNKPPKRDDLQPSGKGSSEDPVFVPGNEGLAEVTAVGDGVHGLNVGDWVVMVKQQTGTWRSVNQVGARDVAKLPRVDGLSEVHGATITVNPPTAYNMLSHFVQLNEGDWVVQNGANSAVGQAVIQIAADRGLKTLNFIRSREKLEDAKQSLYNLGATQVLTYGDLEDKKLRGSVKEWTNGQGIRLALNCVGGKPTSLMAGLVGMDAHLVSYGAMSKQPLSLSTSLFIFKNLTSHGYWQTRWYESSTPDQRTGVLEKLVDLMSRGKLKEPEHDIVHIAASDNDEKATEKLRDVLKKQALGQLGKKLLLKIDEVSE